MKNLILHIGHGKTGSSYLQSMLALNHELLSKYSIDYPGAQFQENAKAGKVSAGNGKDFAINRRNLEEMISIAKNSEHQNILFSSEVFFSALNEKKLKRMQEGLNLRIIIYTRNTIDYKISQWHQSVKGQGNIKTIRDSLEDNLLCHVYSKVVNWIKIAEDLNFELRIRNYSNTINQKFENFVNICTDILIPTEKLNHPQNKRVNRSLSFAETEIMRLLNIYHDNINTRAYSDFFVNRYPSINSYKPSISAELYQKVLVANQELLDVINAQIPTEDRVSVGNKEQLCSTKNSEQSIPIPQKTLRTLARKIPLEIKKTEAERKKRIEFAKNAKLVALAIEAGEPLTIDHALALMRIAEDYTPKGPFIKKKIKEWSAAHNKTQNL